LDNIDGLGAKTKELLIKEFKSLKRIKAASQEEITKLLGQVRGGNIFKRLNEL
jgi:excinuclease ABC subunit C